MSSPESKDPEPVEILNTGIHEFATKVRGQDCTLKIKTDLTWGETQELLSKSVRILENGTKDFMFNNFCDVLLAKTIVEGMPFPATNLVEMKKLPMSEVSLILGEILRVIPLEAYFKNLGMENFSLSPKV